MSGRCGSRRVQERRRWPPPDSLLGAYNTPNTPSSNPRVLHCAQIDAACVLFTCTDIGRTG